jgi:hypothetical protein
MTVLNMSSVLADRLGGPVAVMKKGLRGREDLTMSGSRASCGALSHPPSPGILLPGTTAVPTQDQRFCRRGWRVRPHFVGSGLHETDQHGELYRDRVSGPKLVLTRDRLSL